MRRARVAHDGDGSGDSQGMHPGSGIMMMACVALMVAAASVTGHEAWPTFFEWGGDPAGACWST